MIQTNRLPAGGLVDRAQRLRFCFDGRHYEGHAGDTLASALLANGVRIVGRSFKYHRPRGIMAAGVEEANALVTIGEGSRATPNLKATEVELVDGLVARSVNCWPSARFDIGAAIGLLGRFMPSGFYYKTFMWPSWGWYEGGVRRAAGLGRAPAGPDPDRYVHRYAHCDVLVVGSGPTGLSAAAAAAATGARVMLVEQDPVLGGDLLAGNACIDGLDGRTWAARTLAALAANLDVTLLTRTVAAGYYDHNALSLVETRPPGAGPRQRLWQVRARQVVLATGALERPLVFPGNDRPGIMLLSAIRRYALQFGVVAGRRLVVFTNNDGAYGDALALHAVGMSIATLVDVRPDVPEHLAAGLADAGIELVRGGVVTATHGRRGLTSVSLSTPSGYRRIPCDLLGMAGGWNPVAHLHCQAGGALDWDDERVMFVPGPTRQAHRSAGAANGSLNLAECLGEGHRAGLKAAGGCGMGGPDLPQPQAVSDPRPTICALWQVPGGKAWVDFQNDVTAGDIALAAAENFRSVEHLKRYTTMGMAVDQGKTSNVNGLAILARESGRTVAQTGTTRFRPPYTPVTLNVMRGPFRAELFRPRKLMPAHAWHDAHGAVFEDFGGWQRPVYYPHPGEDRSEAVRREVLAVRHAAGLFESSPLGKIEVKGPDAARFLDRIYVNTMSTLKIGRLRYGLMTNENGVVIDDGVVARLDDDHFLVGTTSGNAERIADWLEEWAQCEWNDLRVLTLPITSVQATLTLTGPNARAVLATVATGIDLSPASFTHMSFREGTILGVPARIARVSFTGEVSFEINIPAGRALDLWERLMHAGKAYGLTPVGVDAWMELRTEKGYLHVGADTDGTTTPLDIGWGSAVDRKQGDFVGKRSLSRPDLRRPDRLNLVGLDPIDNVAAIPVGAHLRLDGGSASDGHVTSVCAGITLGRPVALAMLHGGRDRMNQTVTVMAETGTFRVRVVSPAFYDLKGERLHV